MGSAPVRPSRARILLEHTLMESHGNVKTFATHVSVAMFYKEDVSSSQHLAWIQQYPTFVESLGYAKTVATHVSVGMV